MKTLIRFPLFLIPLLLCCQLQAAQAADDGRILIHDSEGFTTSLPNVSAITVTLHLLELQQDLEADLTQMKQEVERKSFKAIDALVTLIMPGGLIYAKLRHDAYKQSERKLNRVSEELGRISSELIAFQADSGEMRIAAAQ